MQSEQIPRRFTLRAAVGSLGVYPTTSVIVFGKVFSCTWEFVFGAGPFCCMTDSWIPFPTAPQLVSASSPLCQDTKQRGKLQRDFIDFVLRPLWAARTKAELGRAPHAAGIASRVTGFPIFLLCGRLKHHLLGPYTVSFLLVG